MRNEIKVKRNVIIILGIVFLLGICLELTRSEFILRWSVRENATAQPERVVAQDGISQQELMKRKQEKYLIVFDPDEEASVELKNNLSQVLDYMKKEYDIVDVLHIKRVDPRYMTVIWTFEQWKKIADIDAVVEYVAQGGHLFAGVRPDIDDTFYRLYRKMGVNSIGDYGDYVEAKGIKLMSNLLLQNADMEVQGDFLNNSSIPVELDTKQCHVYAVAPNQIPLLWDVSFNKGKFMIFNGTILHEKMSRGLIAGALGFLQPDFMYPIVNAKIFYIDDFPAPFPEGVNPQIYRDYQKDISSFFRDIWWPEMVKNAARYDLKYTGMIIETYNDRIDPPFEQFGSSKNNLITYGRDLLKSGGELGFHGYNHQSLVTDQSLVSDLGYNAWPDTKNMSESLTELKNYTQSVFPDYTIHSYVPPSNILDEEGRETLVEAVPDIQIISSVYHEDATGKAYVQEFAKSDDGLIELPRLTAGYEYTEDNKYAIANGLTSLGVFSHFVHPDDILDSSRNNGKSWPVISQEYQQMLKDVSEKYHWLRSMTATEAGKELDKFLLTKVYLDQTEQGIHGYLNHFTGDMYFILRTTKEVTSTKHCKIKKIDEGVFLVHVDSPQFEIELEG